MNKRTTVIVLGDARNNYNLPHDWCLREISQRAKRVIWLNPESRNTWGFGDSEMDRYAPHCDLVEECRNLNQLYRVVDRLVAALTDWILAPAQLAWLTTRQLWAKIFSRG